MYQRPPFTIQAIRVLLALKLFFIALVLFFLAYTKDLAAGTKTFLGGLRDSLRARYPMPSNDFAYEMGKVTGAQIIPVVLTILLFIFIGKRKFKPAVICASLDLVFGFGQGLPIASAIVLVMLVLDPAKSWMNPDKQNPPAMDIDQQSL
ncbi:MAG: hypothetical protein JNJ58_14490 [Chitinophagaceae bacterium]|nr:hypothetical protein [Chitinophagaceae bacterium]